MIFCSICGRPWEEHYRPDMLKFKNGPYGTFGLKDGEHTPHIPGIHMPTERKIMDRDQMAMFVELPTETVYLAPRVKSSVPSMAGMTGYALALNQYGQVLVFWDEEPAPEWVPMKELVFFNDGNDEGAAE